MGCHTWVYEKVKDVPSDEVMFKYFTKVTFEDGVRKYGEWDLKYEGVSDSWYTETCYKDQPNNKQRVIDINKIPEEIRHLAELTDYFFEIPEANFDIVFDSYGLYKSNGYHDIFRIAGYPEDIWLHSYDECEKFINSKNVVTELPKDYDADEVKSTDRLYCLTKSKEETLTICKKFYEEHPDTLIRFG